MKALTGGLPAPDFVLVGAPKSATGTIDALLRSRPDVFMAPKDRHFFAPDLHSTQVRLSPPEYDRQFETAARGALLGEASVGYLCSADAARLIHDRRPDAKVVISLRDPLT